MARSIYVIDDDPAFCSFLSDALTESGYDVTAYTDPAVALTALQTCSSTPDAVLIDLVMPGQTGRDIAVAMHADSALRETPIVLISALPVPNLAASLKIAAVLRKPFELDQLLGILNSFEYSQTPRTENRELRTEN